MTAPLRFPAAGEPAPTEPPTDSAAPAASAAATGERPATPIDPVLSGAKRHYAEQFGDVIVTNTYLKLTIAALVLICLALVVTQIRTAKTIAEFKPLVIRIDQIGRAEVVRYDDMTYTPREAEIKYFLSQFVRLYYSRNRTNLASNFRASLVFLEPQLADSIVAAWTNQKVVEQYVQSNMGDVDIAIKGVSISNLQESPYQASVDYEQIYYASRERTETRRVLYKAHFTFRFETGVLPTAVLAQNPLGLVIQHFREDAVLSAPLSPVAP